MESLSGGKADIDQMSGLETIEDFNPKTIPDDPSIIVASPRRAGKSVIISYLIWILQSRKYQEFDEVFLFSATQELQPDMYKFVPKENRVGFLDEGKLNEIYNSQVEKTKEYNNGMRDKPYKVLIILDDLIGSTGKSMFYSNVLNKYFTTARHLHASIFTLVQNYKSVNSVCRKNADLLITFKQHNYNDVNGIAEEYLCLNYDKQMMKKGCAIFDKIVSEEFQAMVIDVPARNKAINHKDYIFKYRANKTKLPDDFFIKPANEVLQNPIIIGEDSRKNEDFKIRKEVYSRLL